MGKSIDINLDELKVLYNQGLSDSEIAERLDCSRKTIERRRNELGLKVNYWKSSIWNQVETVKKLFKEGKSNAEICKIINVSNATLTKFKKAFSITGNYDIKMSKEDVNEAMLLAKDGLTDTEIAKLFNVARSTITWHRKNNDVKSGFTYDRFSKIDKEKFEQLFDSGLSDAEIAKALNVSTEGVYSYRMRNGYLRESLREAKENPLTQDNLEIILGIMMGDGHMERCNANARMSFAHCPQQKEYTKYIAEKLSNLHPYLHHAVAKPHKKTGKVYESYWCTLPANPAFNSIYEHFYKDGKKRIPLELFKDFTWQSLAYMYMDDGMWGKSGGYIATNCFSVEELHTFQEFLLSKFNIETSVCKNHVLYIKANSFRLMKSMIEPYMCKCMKYKIK